MKRAMQVAADKAESKGDQVRGAGWWRRLLQYQLM
jgi:hypothetical protein